MAARKKPLDVRAARTAAVLMVVVGAIAAWALRPAANPTVTGDDEVWELTAAIDVEPSKVGAKVTLYGPMQTASTRVIGARLDHFGFAARSRRGRPGSTTLTCVEAGPRRIHATWRLHHRAGAKWPTLPTATGADERTAALASTSEIPTAIPEVVAALKSLSDGRPPIPEVVRRIFAFCRERIHVEPGGRDDVAGALTERVASPRGRARAMVALCRAARVPARIGAGVELAESDDVTLRVWTEVLQSDRWLAHDLDTGMSGPLPVRLVPLASPNLVSAGRARVSCRRRVAPLAGARELREVFDLSRLPVTHQTSLILLLMLPLGALLSAAMTTFLGVRPFGTFTPTLLAATFLRTDIRVSSAVLIAVLVFGLGGRWLLQRLGLDRAHRLSVIFTLVALAMVFVASGLDYVGLSDASGPALLPIVVLTMIVDRLSAVADDLGVPAAIRRLCWTLAIAAAVAPLLSWDWLGQVLLGAPHLHLFTGAAFLALGTYTGPKWFDRGRLRWLLEPEKPSKKKKGKKPSDEPPADSSDAL